MHHDGIVLEIQSIHLPETRSNKAPPSQHCNHSSGVLQYEVMKKQPESPSGGKRSTDLGR
jgi:hypothetical protein